MKTIKSILAVALFAIPFTNALAVDECGAEAAGADTINCPAAAYGSGITYTNSDGLTLDLNDAGISSAAGGVRLQGAFGTNTNELRINAANFGLISSTGAGGGAVRVSANGQENATIEMSAGTVMATGGSHQGLRADLANNIGITGREAKIIFNGGAVSSAIANALYTQVDGGASGSSLVEIHGGMITGRNGVRAAILGASPNSRVNPATVLMDGGSILTGSIGIRVQHSGTLPGATSSVTVTGPSTTVTSGNGILIDNPNTSTGTYNVVVSAGANVTGTGALGRAIHTDSDPANTVNIDVLGAATVVDGSGATAGVFDNDGAATITSTGQILGGIQTNAGDDVLLLQNGSTTTGTIDMGADQDTITISATADITGVTLIDGGADATDVLTFSGVARNDTFVGSALPNWERIILDQAALTLTGDLTTGIIRVNNNGSLFVNSPTTTVTGAVDVNSSGKLFLGAAGTTAYSVSGAMTNAGLITLQDNVAGDSLSLGSTYGSAGDTTGVIRLDVLDAVTRDNIVIAGPIAGSTALEINNLGLPLVPGTIIPLITTAGGPGVFTLFNGPIVLAGGTYDLVRAGNNWNLVAAGFGVVGGNPIPTLGGWAIFLLSGLMVLFGLRRMRKFDAI